MSSSAPKLATYADLLALGEDVRGEIIAGVVETQPGPLGRHARVQRVLSNFVGGPFDDDDGRGGPGGWWIFVELDIQLSTSDIVRPDLSGWRRARLPSADTPRPVTVRPDWVCEIISPSTAGRDRVTKRALYAQHGVPWYWIVDPVLRNIEALELAGGRWTEVAVCDDTATLRIPPFDDIVLEVGRLFVPRDADPAPTE